jgi:hypothetical protein
MVKLNNQPNRARSCCRTGDDCPKSKVAELSGTKVIRRQRTGQAAGTFSVMRLPMLTRFSTENPSDE